MKRRIILAVLAILAMVGCNNADPTVDYEATGTVRNVWVKEYATGWWTDISFEFDDGNVRELTFSQPVPFWQNEHVQMHYGCYRSGLSGCWLVSAKVIK